MAFKLDGKTLPVDVAFTSNGINYPANWLRLTTLAEKKGIGITEVTDEATYDQRFYLSASKAKALEDVNAKDKKGLKACDVSSSEAIKNMLKARETNIENFFDALKSSQDISTIITMLKEKKKELY